MLKGLKNFVKTIIPQANGLQRIYLGLYYFGLWGMNFGRTADLKGSGELKALKLLRFHLGDSPTILDVGANIGDYSIALVETFPRANIHSFEPVRATFEMLCYNTESFQNITTHHLGLGDLDEDSKIFFSETSAHSSMLGHRGVQSQDQFTETIQVVRLDNFALTAQIEIVDFLKIDVEGFEINVLRGAEELLKAKKIKCIQFEFGGTMIDAHVFLKDFYDLLDENYNLFRITKSGLFPIGGYHSHYEIFHYCNYMAILKD
ncbi:MAG: FkbM family methyltransferase [Cyclobacteriaceae bacterium]